MTTIPGSDTVTQPEAVSIEFDLVMRRLANINADTNVQLVMTQEENSTLRQQRAQDRATIQAQTEQIAAQDEQIIALTAKVAAHEQGTANEKAAARPVAHSTGDRDGGAPDDPDTGTGNRDGGAPE